MHCMYFAYKSVGLYSNFDIFSLHRLFMTFIMTFNQDSRAKFCMRFLIKFYI